MKKVFTLLCGVAISVVGMTAMAASEYKSIVIHKTDGSSLAVTMETDLAATFNAGNLQLSCSKGDILIPSDEVSKWTFSTEPGTAFELAGIDGVVAEADGVSVSVLSDRVVMENLPVNSTVSLVGVDGRVVSLDKVSGHHELPLTGLQGGVYVLTYNNNSLKIIARR